MTTLDLPIDPATGRPVWHGLPVPWVAKWTGEIITDEPLHSVRMDGQLHIVNGPNPAASPFGIRAAIAGRRDEFGLMWDRDRDAPGTGEPKFAVVHARRQRACMIDRRCQVCGNPFGDEPVTFLESTSLKDDDGNHHYDLPGQPYFTIQAPVCRTCIPVALRKCPAQRKARHARVIVTAHAYHPHAVLADVYNVTAKRGLFLETPRFMLALDDPALTRAIAKQLYVMVTDYTEEPVP